MVVCATALSCSALNSQCLVETTFMHAAHVLLVGLRGSSIHGGARTRLHAVAERGGQGSSAAAVSVACPNPQRSQLERWVQRRVPPRGMFHRELKLIDFREGSSPFHSESPMIIGLGTMVDNAKTAIVGLVRCEAAIQDKVRPLTGRNDFTKSLGARGSGTARRKRGSAQAFWECLPKQVIMQEMRIVHIHHGGSTSRGCDGG